MLLIQSDRPQRDLPPSRPPLDPRGTGRPLRGSRPPRRAAAQRGERTPSRSARSRSSPARSRPPPRSASPSTSFTRSPRARGRSSRESCSTPPRSTRPTPCTAATERSSSTATHTATTPTSGSPSSTTQPRRCSSPRSWTAIRRRSSGRPRRRCAGCQARSPASTRIRARRRRLSPTRSLAFSSCACSPMSLAVTSRPTSSPVAGVPMRRPGLLVPRRVGPPAPLLAKCETDAGLATDSRFDLAEGRLGFRYSRLRKRTGDTYPPCRPSVSDA